MIWIDLIYNLTLLIALSVISGFVDTRWKRNSRYGVLLQGLVFGGAAAIGMLRPFVFAPGLFFDGRSVMISLGALFFGPWTATIACLMTIPIRIIQGGPGVVMGVMVIMVSAAIGTGVHLYRRRKPVEISTDSLFVFGIAVHIAMLTMTIALPQSMIVPVLKCIGWPVMLIYPLATVLIGKILSDQAARTLFMRTLRRSEEKFRIIANYTVDWESWFGPDGKYLWVSPSVEQFTGYSAEEVLAMPDFISTLIVATDRQLVTTALQKALRGEKGDNLEFRYVRKNGFISWLSVAWQPVFDASGNSLGVRTSGRDITELKQMQKALEQQIVALTRPLNEAPDIAFDQLFDLDNFQRIQDEFSAATGVASIITGPDGTPITRASNFTRLCFEIIRKTEKGCSNCFKSDAALGKKNQDGPVVQICLSGGLWDAGVRITVGDRHIANWLIGQVRDETQTEEQMLQYAREIGADEQAFLEAFREVPCMPRKRFEQIAQALFTLANQLSTSAYNIQQARFITERKQMQQALEQRVVALTRPLNQSENISFDDLFDRAEIQRIQDEFAAATGVTSAIFLPDGTEVTTVSYTTTFCRHVVRVTEKGCANCAKSDMALGRAFNPNGPVVQRCLSAGLWDGCVAIMIGDQHIANWTLGQVRDETQTEEQALQYAREIGADEQTFLTAYRKLPIMSGEKFKQIAQALFTLANQLSTSAHQNIQQARFIAERQKAEQNLLRLSTAINQTVEAVVVTDVHGIIQYVNPAFEFITGYLQADVIGKNSNFLKSGKHEESFYRDLWKTISSGRTWTGLFINKRKNGSLYTEETTISPVCDQNGVIINYVAVKRDITDELSKEDEYRQAQKMEAVGQLAGGVAHDFNNILQAILGFSEILLSKLKEDTSEYRNVTEIKKAAARAADITRQLLAFSRKQPVNKRQININTVIQDTEVLLQLLLGNNVSRVLDLTQNLNPVEADSGQITQIIMNLAINARDAMPDGGRLTISTENIRLTSSDTSVIPGSEPGEFVCLSVTDTGCGMSRKVKDHLFEPFFTTKEPGKGTGLGLAGIYGIVKKHKGWINVYSEETLGTTFKVYLPVIKPKDSSAEQADEENETHQDRILLVEDDQAVCNMVIRLLEDAGYRICATGSAEEAFAQFEHKQAEFDLLFSDIILPEQNGIELADRIRKIKPSLPVLLYSGYRDQRERWSNLDSKGYHFLQKPFTATTLLAAVYDTLTEAEKQKK